MTPIRRGTAAALLALSLPLAATAPAQAEGPTATGPERIAARAVVPLELPRPTGPYTVGVTTLPLTDTDRPDRWEPSSGPRRLLVDIRYPARPGGGEPRQAAMSAEEARALLERTGYGVLIPVGNADRLAATRTHARVEARPAHGRFPLVVLSPGFGLPRTTLSLLGDELASRGYVVASVDHAHESEATAFPGEAVLPCTACRKVDESKEEPRSAVPETRAKDVSFLLDRLTGRDPAWRHARMIDRSRIGMAGHSIGGNSAASAMAEDRRVRAGINMDGSFFGEVPATGLDGRPFLLLGAERAAPGTDPTWDATWPRLDGWKRWLTVTGGHHFSFIDAPALADGADGAPSFPGTPSGRRSAEITRAHAVAFFDLHLKGVPQPLLNGPSPAHPEVVFHRP
ncbi:alpha/beta hydrolase family protein [Streptomyces clavuligerus]|uniref:Platelet-activating factor acetylhydrolase, plasma/intracellular isoform II n=1 Tax=Streptomyces clavuligerus TaxID=1901 RepID=B5H2S1_STRCL|nr:hypothetical protein [Streptomyces clavuligerus]ANW18934.1 acetylhydrolase [Streptomyces clavuligerus]AXU13512.1 alpha/beta hydrolase [Streptomyces clavuligerus]EDY52867.1 conserved hypothetical protein [Streptomyces clavuligerus]EFG08358.1 Platelet-activating factor acetylhydrolase, plasma/intracellular isoform II [Streptomyces clavuligerus]MBY6303470.1 alpha/beta hydrolase [Streptomyces clavuligerus]